MSTVTAIRGKYELRKSASNSSGFLPVLLEVYLLTEIVPLAELLSDDANNVLRVQVGLCKNQRLRHFRSTGKDFCQPVLEGLYDQTNLVFGNNVPVELRPGIAQVVIELLVLLTFGAPVPHWHEDTRLFGELCPIFGNLSFDAVDIVADVHAIGDGLFVSIFLDQIAVKESDGLRGRCGGQTDEERIEVFQGLPPQIIDGTVTFIDPTHEIKRLYRNLGVIDHRQRRTQYILFCLEEGVFLVLVKKLRLTFQDGVQRRMVVMQTFAAGSMVFFLSCWTLYSSVNL